MSKIFSGRFWDEHSKKKGAKNNKKIAILFPGQGGQKIGMSIDISPGIIQGLCNQMEIILGQTIASRISRLILTDPANLTPDEKEKMSAELLETRNTQLAIFLDSLARFQEYVNSEDFIIPWGMLGHSLGECTALVASGAMTIEDGFKYVFYRGGEMYHATILRKGGMTAVRGNFDEKAKLLEWCLINGRDVETVNYNSPWERVVAGGLPGLEIIEEELIKSGFKATRLPVAGAFHHPAYMAIVEAALEKFFELYKVQIRKPIFNMLFNYTGGIESDPKRIVTYITKQPANTVRFEQQVSYLIKEHIEMKEIGSKIFARQLVDFPDYKKPGEEVKRE